MKKLSVKIFVSYFFTFAPGGIRILVQQEKSAKLGRVGSARSAGTRTVRGIAINTLTNYSTPKLNIGLGNEKYMWIKKNLVMALLVS